jgi:hypothetical protein
MMYLNFLGSCLIMVGLPTAVFDMGMNGARYSAWVPWGLGMAALGIVLVSL